MIDKIIITSGYAGIYDSFFIIIHMTLPYAALCAHCVHYIYFHFKNVMMIFCARIICKYALPIFVPGMAADAYVP